MRFSLMTILLCLFSSYSFAKGVGILDREKCIYNGKKLDKSIPKETKVKIPKIAENFNGKVVCYSRHYKTKKERLTETYHVLNGKLHGDYIKYDLIKGKNDVGQIESYINGQRTALKRYNHQSGHIQNEFLYKDKNQHGPQKAYHRDNGQLKSIKWVQKKRIKKKTDISFNQDGSLSRIECGPQSLIADDQVWCGRNGKRSKVITYRWNSREKKSYKARIMHFKNNELDGDFIQLDKSGNPKEKKIYKMGKVIEKIRYIDGDVVAKELLSPSKKTATHKSYYANKNIKSISKWLKGRKESEIRYYQNGKKQYEYTFGKDKKALIKTYYDNGKLESSGKYYRKSFYSWSYWGADGEIKRYWENGKLFSTRVYKSGRPNGNSIWYNRKGIKHYSRKFKKGRLIEEADYDQNGKTIIRKTEYYEDGSFKMTEGSKSKV